MGRWYAGQELCQNTLGGSALNLNPPKEISVLAEKERQCTLLRKLDGNRFWQAVSVCGAHGCT